MCLKMFNPTWTSEKIVTAERNDEDQAPQNNEDDRQALPRHTRQTARESGVPVPEFPNVQPTVLEQSRRDQAAAREIMNQFRQQTTDALLRNRQNWQQDYMTWICTYT